tara:strand:+ start:4262 stop:4483 length:222 start_codon:yes stop_codon:yes gene_type:complete
MKLTKSKLKQLIKEAFEEDERHDLHLSRHNLREAEGVMAEVKDLLQTWESNPGTVESYLQDLLELINNIKISN